MLQKHYLSYLLSLTRENIFIFNKDCISLPMFLGTECDGWNVLQQYRPAFAKHDLAKPLDVPLGVPRTDLVRHLLLRMRLITTFQLYRILGPDNPSYRTGKISKLIFHTFNYLDTCITLTTPKWCILVSSIHI